MHKRRWASLYAVRVRVEKNALWALFTGAVLIGFAPIFVRLADVGWSAVGFWRAALALPLLAAFCARSGGFGFVRQRGSAALLLAGACFGLDLLFWHQGIRYSSVANATLLTNLAPAFVALYAFVLAGERQTRGFMLGLLLALIGAALLVSDSLRVSLETVKGDAFGTTSAVFYAGYLFIVSRERSRFSTAQVMLISTFAMGLVCGAAALAMGDTLLPQSLRGWLILLGLAWLSHVAGQGSIAWALAHLPAAFSAVGLLVQPLAAALFAWVLLSQPFGPRQALGGAIVIAGIVLCRLASMRAAGQSA